MTALLVGAVLAVAALAYVLLPLFEMTPDAAQQPSRRPTAPVAPAENAIDALREIEFDRATGKLSDVDYASLKARYTRSALVEMRSRGGSAGDSSLHDAVTPPPAGSVDASLAGSESADAVDAAEAAVLRHRSVRRSCDTCGPRPEPDPVFCSSCGKYLKGPCARCGAPIDKPASRFCANCGGSLAA